MAPVLVSDARVSASLSRQWVRDLLLGEPAQKAGGLSMIPRLLSVTHVARQLGLSESALYRLVDLRRIPFRKIGGRIWFTEPDLEEWMEARKVLAVPDLGGTAPARTPRTRDEACEVPVEQRKFLN